MRNCHPSGVVILERHYGPRRLRDDDDDDDDSLEVHCRRTLRFDSIDADFLWTSCVAHTHAHTHTLFIQR